MSNSTSTVDKRTIYQAPPGRPPETPMPKWWLAAVILGGLTAFLLVVGRAEISRWYFAATENAIDDRRYEDAVEAADTGLGWDPDYVQLVAMRALAKTQLNEFEAAIEDYDRVIELASKRAPFGETVLNAKSTKAMALQRLGKYPEAIDLLSEVVSFHEEDYRLRNDSVSQNRYAGSLNNRAYVEAQAHVAGEPNIDIELALADIEKGIDLRADDDPIFIDTLGYLQLLNGKNEDAFYHLDQAVNLTENGNKRKKARLKELMLRATDQRPYQERLKRLNEDLAVILHHRGEAHRALGNEASAKTDIDRALKLGFNPEEGIW